MTEVHETLLDCYAIVRRCAGWSRNKPSLERGARPRLEPSARRRVHHFPVEYGEQTAHFLERRGRYEIRVAIPDREVGELAGLEHDAERSARVVPWERAVRLAASTSRRVGAEFRSSSRLHNPSTVIFPLTTRVLSEDAFPLRVRVPAGTAGLARESEVLVDQMLAWDNALFREELGLLPEALQMRVRAALLEFLDLT